MIAVTPKAVEKIRQAFAREGVEGGLRLAAIGGGFVFRNPRAQKTYGCGSSFTA